VNGSVTEPGARAPANDIEHGVLRGNAASPASPFVLLGLPQLAGRTFKAGDPRLAQARPGARPPRVARSRPAGL